MGYEQSFAVCLELRTGKVKWTAERKDGLYVGCVYGGKALIVGGTQVMAKQLTSGAIVWNLRLPSGVWPSGQGVRSGDYYYLPLSSKAIAQIEMKTGKVTSIAKSHGKHAPGNLVYHRGVFLSQGPQYLEAFDERRKREE